MRTKLFVKNLIAFLRFIIRKGVQRQIARQKKIDKFEMQLIDILLNH